MPNTTVFEVRSDIPPPNDPRHRGPRGYPWRGLEVGGSFFVPDLTRKSMAPQCSMTGTRLGRRFVCRNEGTGVRVWRTE